MTRSSLKRTGLFFVVTAILLCNAGQTCAPPANTVTVELINDSFDEVDPGLFVDGTEFLFDPITLAAGEIVTVEFDCFAGTTFETDAILFPPGTQINSENVPIAEENVEFQCGDSVTFIFVDDGQTFFTRLEVNGQFVSD